MEPLTNAQRLEAISQCVELLKVLSGKPQPDNLWATTRAKPTDLIHKLPT